MIKLEHVSKEFTKGIRVVDDVNLEVLPGEIFGFIGPNGAGKTTTIKMITGVTDFDEGRITVAGKDIQEEALEAKKQFCYVADSPDIFLRLKGIEYLNFMGTIYAVPVEKRKEKIKELTEKFEIADALNNKIQSYSHGMRQKLIITGALLAEPKIWILDEPMTGLDPKSSFLLKEMMREHAAKGFSVFFSTHVLEVAEKLCDRIGIIDKGKLLFVGTIAELKEKYASSGSLESVFLEITKNA